MANVDGASQGPQLGTKYLPPGGKEELPLTDTKLEKGDQEGSLFAT